MKTLVENLEREGGHILVLVFLVILFLGVGLIVPSGSIAERMSDAGFGAMLGALVYCMKGNSPQKNSDGFTTTTEKPSTLNSQLSTKGEGGHILVELAVLCVVILLFCTGCCTRRSDTKKVYFDEKIKATITEETHAAATTFFDSKSTLTAFKNAITDKTSGTSIGSATQETSGSNAVQVLRIVVEGAAKAATSP